MNTDFSRTIVFKIGKEEYGIDIKQVQSIERMQPVTAIPNSSPALIGVTNIRGKVLPIFDLRKILSAEAEIKDDTRIILVECQGKTMGIVVDEANEVIEIIQDTIQQPSFTVEQDTFIKGIAMLDGRLLILIDIEKLVLQDNVQGDMEHLQEYISQETV